LPGDKLFCFNGLRGVVVCKYGQTKGLSLNLGKQRELALDSFLKRETPGFGRGLFLISSLIIAVWAKLIRQLYPILFV
jgi:hypothetical protein